MQAGGPAPEGQLRLGEPSALQQLVAHRVGIARVVGDDREQRGVRGHQHPQPRYAAHLRREREGTVARLPGEGGIPLLAEELDGGPGGGERAGGLGRLQGGVDDAIARPIGGGPELAVPQRH